MSRTNTITFLVILTFVFMASTAEGKIIYVDTDANGSNDGSFWADAYMYLQDALADANSSAKPVEIRVAQGVYKPDQGACVTSGDRYAGFQLISGVKLKGGYAGYGEPDPNTRDIEAFETILSGDLNRDDEPDFTNYSENSYHVVTVRETDETAVLDGFVIMAGNADGWVGDAYTGEGALSPKPPPRRRDHTVYGGGIYINAGSPKLLSCIFKNNFAYECGGGLYNGEGSPTIISGIFKGNLAKYSGGGMGNGNYGQAVLDRCVFEHNCADEIGGAIYNRDSNLLLTYCKLRSNSAWINSLKYSKGGAIYNIGGVYVLNKCVLQGNTAHSGGALYNSTESKSMLVNCTFAGNTAEHGNSVTCESEVSGTLISVEATNCIFWGSRGQIYVDGPPTIVRYSDVQGGWPGEGNIDVEPCFVDPGRWVNANDPNLIAEPSDPNAVWVNGDYHLKSQAGRWDPVSESWVQDDVTSPCIDAGDPNTPVGDEPFPNGGIINMGAYGGTAEASKSYFGEPVCETIVAGDINGDCKVDFKDFQLMALHGLEQY